jgi:hypothetical protein
MFFTITPKSYNLKMELPNLGVFTKLPFNCDREVTSVGRLFHFQKSEIRIARVPKFQQIFCPVVTGKSQRGATSASLYTVAPVAPVALDKSCN